MSTLIHLTEALSSISKTCYKQEEDIRVLTAVNEEISREHAELKELYERQREAWQRANDQLTYNITVLQEAHAAELARLRPAPSNAPEMPPAAKAIAFADIATKLNLGEDIRVMYGTTEYVATWDGANIESTTLGKFRTACAWSTAVHKVLRNLGAVRNRKAKVDHKDVYVIRGGTKTTLLGLMA